MAASVLLLALLPPLRGASGAEVNYYDLLSTDKVGAHAFIRAHPEWDGRGVVVAVLDTGVDMSVAGLRVTSAGETKVVEARDFSGQGVVHLRKPAQAKESKEEILKTGDGAVRGFAGLTPKPEESSLLLGFLDEGRFRNSAVSDINNNGRPDDSFAILMGKITVDDESRWVAWIDTDADGHVDDEEMQEEYALHQKHFFFQARGDQNGRPTMAIALHLAPKRREVELHFPDGSHGSHVAGIAAGFELFGKKGFHGIAPGARVMSLKIGDNTLSGGSTTTESMKRALEFAGQWSEKHKTPVVVNMSYGIGTEKEGEADIDRITDNVLRKHPLLSVATSAGNSGPGLSTVGTPAGAHLAFSTGALLTRDNARSLYAARIARDVIFYFSSRGGELAKPDGLAPGCAASAVPPWETWPVMRGTSMASPQAAGCLALLASGAAQAAKPLAFNGGLLMRALRNSGRPVEGYSLADQGYGLVHVPRAWESLKKLSARKASEIVAGYKVTADCPTCPNGKAVAGFFRAGTYLPARPFPVGFIVKPLFLLKAGKEQKKNYFETFDLTVEGDWLEPTADAIFFNGQGGASVDVFIDRSKLKKPGLHTAQIRGTSRESDKSRKSTMFDLSSGFSKRFERQALAPGEVERYFLRVPEGAASMRIDLSPVKGKYTQSRLALFDPEGHELPVDGAYADSTRKSSAGTLVSGADLKPGTWEVVVVTHYVARGKSHYNLDVRFSGFHYKAPEEFYYEMGSPPRAVFELRTLFDQVFEGRAKGGLFGFYRKQSYSTTGDKLNIPLSMEKGVGALRVVLRVDRETYARFTDCAVSILDSKGNAVEKGGFSSLTTTLEVANPNAATGEAHFNMEIIGGLAENTGQKWTVQVEEFHEKNDYIPAKVWCDGYSYFTLYPNVVNPCEFELQEKPTIAPNGFLHYGELRFNDARTKQRVLVMPLRMRVGE